MRSPSSGTRLVAALALLVLMAPGYSTWARPLRTIRKEIVRSQRAKARRIVAAGRIDDSQRETRALRRRAAGRKAMPAAPSLATGDGSISLVAVLLGDDDDDSRIKKKRRRKPPKTNATALTESPRLRPATDFVSVLRVRLEREHPRPHATAEPIPHFGSGPCHSIPCPREGTPCPAPRIGFPAS